MRSTSLTKGKIQMSCAYSTKFFSSMIVVFIEDFHKNLWMLPKKADPNGQNAFSSNCTKSLMVPLEIRNKSEYASKNLERGWHEINRVVLWYTEQPATQQGEVFQTQESVLGRLQCCIDLSGFIPIGRPSHSSSPPLSCSA